MVVGCRRFPLALAFAALATWGCGGEDLVLPPDGSSVQLRIMEGDGQSGPPGAPLAGMLIVRLVDDAGKGVANRSIIWAVTDGGGSLEPGNRTTDPAGFAVAQWTLGPSPGPNAAQAQVPGAGAVTFSANATGDGGGSGTGAARIEAAEGDGQTAPAGRPVPIAPSVRVTDAGGAPVAGVSVTFAVAGGGGSVNDGDTATDAEGIARPGAWTLGPDPGTNVLEARAGSLQGSPVVFIAQGSSLSREVDRLVFRTPPRDAREWNSFRVEVALVDDHGDVVPLSGVFVYLGLFRKGKDVPVNKRLHGERFANTRNGIATFDISIDHKGTYRLRALTDDLPELGPHGPEPYLYSDDFEIH